ncbi:MAG: L-threonine 3-dehydrogenase [Vampirovibrio sp.]|nr:L-threonine 3-dehydrogenase [Vampirovibrio sp.]
MAHSYSTATSDNISSAQTMLAVQKPAAEPGFHLVQAPIPEIGPEDVLVKVSLASICGTDLHITEWDNWSASRIKPPLIYGHEFCGVVEAVGKDVKKFHPGMRVSAEMHVPCRHCRQCMTGNLHICEQVQILGVDGDGCFAQYVKIPRLQLVTLPPEVSDEYGACLDSLGNAVHAVSRAEVSGKAVHIVGCGPVGLFAIKVAHALGATRVFASDVVPYRLELAEKAGADAVFDASKTTVSAEILAATKGMGADVVLEMSGNPHALKDGLTGLKNAGTVVLFGIFGQPVPVNLNQDIIFKEAQVIGVNGRRMFDTWILMLDLLEAKKIDIDFMLTHRFDLSDFGKAIELIGSGHSGKILLKP